MYQLLTLIFQNLKSSHDPEHILSVVIYHSCTSINHHTAFELFSFTNCKDTIGAKFKKTGHVTLIMPISGQSVMLKLGLDIF